MLRQRKTPTRISATSYSKLLKDDIPHSVTRVKTAYGFDKPGIDGLALLRMYRSLLEQHGIHPILLDRWRTSASMQRNILKTTPINPKLLSVLQDLDADMKGKDFRFCDSRCRECEPLAQVRGAAAEIPYAQTISGMSQLWRKRQRQQASTIRRVPKREIL